MNINKQFKPAFLYVTKFMGLIYLNMKILLITLAALFSNDALAFSIGAAHGLNCGLGNIKDVPISCTSANKYLSNTLYEEVHQHITHEALKKEKFVYIKPGSTESISFLPKQLIQIQDANKLVDYNQSNPALHFDNESFDQAIQKLQGLELGILKSLKNPQTIDISEAIRLREAFGFYLHTLQDFFSHSSWVNNHPNNDDVPHFWNLTIPLPPKDSSPCPYISGVSPDTGTLRSNSSFTSGYAFDPLKNGVAPFFKCAHGLLGNGIHKDWTGRDLHEKARPQSEYATTEAAKYILNVAENNPDNVCMFMTDEPCPKKASSVTVLKTGTGKGKVTSTPAGIDCGDGSRNICQFIFENAPNITLLAEVSSGSTFKGWSGAGAGACSGTTNATCTINLTDYSNILSTSSINISAIFDAEQSSNPAILGTWRGLIYQGNAVPVCFQNTIPPATLVTGCLNSFEAIFSTTPQNETGATVLMTSNITTTVTENGAQTTTTSDTTIISQDATWTYDPLSKTVKIFVGGNGNILQLASGTLSVDNQNKQILTFGGSLAATFTR